MDMNIDMNMNIDINMIIDIVINIVMDINIDMDMNKDRDINIDMDMNYDCLMVSLLSNLSVNVFHRKICHQGTWREVFIGERSSLRFQSVRRRLFF